MSIVLTDVNCPDDCGRALWDKSVQAISDGLSWIAGPVFPPNTPAAHKIRQPMPLGNTGPEHGHVSGFPKKEVHNTSARGGAECGAESVDSGQIAPDLAKVVEAWPALPEAVRKGILAMVEAARGE